MVSWNLVCMCTFLEVMWACTQLSKCACVDIWMCACMHGGTSVPVDSEIMTQWMVSVKWLKCIEVQVCLSIVNHYYSVSSFCQRANYTEVQVFLSAAKLLCSEWFVQELSAYKYKCTCQLGNHYTVNGFSQYGKCVEVNTHRLWDNYTVNDLIIDNFFIALFSN